MLGVSECYVKHGMFFVQKNKGSEKSAALESENLMLVLTRWLEL